MSKEDKMNLDYLNAKILNINYLDTSGYGIHEITDGVSWTRNKDGSLTERNKRKFLRPMEMNFVKMSDNWMEKW